MDDSLFSILIDESFDLEEQMIVIIPYLDKKVKWLSWFLPP